MAPKPGKSWVTPSQPLEGMFSFLPVLAGIRGDCVERLAVFLRELRQKIRCEQALLQPTEHPFFYFCPLDSGAVGTDRSALVAGTGAAKASLVDQRVACTAAGAAQETRQQIGRAARPGQRETVGCGGGFARAIPARIGPLAGSGRG